MKYSFIVPVYNRPEEVDELLDSLTKQKYTDFEVIIVEDGSDKDCKAIVEKYIKQLDIKYFMKANSGPGQSRNYGAERAQGKYLIVLDSDVVVPQDYLQAVETELKNNPTDAFGGPDKAHLSFTDIQKAISYSMTSFFTTGGIRGGKKKLDKFYPRSFNMGIRKDVYMALNGFSKMRFGEDIDFSIRIFKSNYRCRLFPEAWVWHKRRTDLKKFFRQVYNSGIARINLYKKYPESLKLVHLMPMLFTLGTMILILTAALGRVMMVYGNADDFYLWYKIVVAALAPILLYSLIICIDATIKNKSIKIGILSIAAAFVQLTGYGFGFINAWWKRCVCGKDEFHAFEKTFYK